MEFTQRVGRWTFTAQITIDDGKWSIRSGAYRCTVPMHPDEWQQWVDTGRPADPESVPGDVEKLLRDLAKAGTPPRPATFRRVKYGPDAWAPLDGEEFVRVIIIEKRTIRFGEPGEIVTARLRCDSPRCRPGSQRPRAWLVVQLPESRYDTAEVREEDGEVRVEGVSPREFAAQHYAWHRDTFGISPRVKLDHWINRHADVAMPELTEEQRREIDAALAIAKSEH
jgi:hypothetical protein